MIFFLFIVVAVLSIIHGYVAHKFIHRVSRSSLIQIALWTVLFVMAMSPLIPPVLRAWNVENSAIDNLALLAYTSLGFFTLAFAYLFAMDIILIGYTLIKKFTGDARNIEKAKFDEKRREFLFKTAQNVIIIASAGLTSYGFIKARTGPDIIKVNVPIKNLPPELHGLKILQLSDIHVGPTIKKDYVQHIVNLSKEQKPDLIAITGDMVDGSVDYLSNDVEPLRDLDAPLGKYFCTGNHEYYAGVEHWLQKVKELGYTSLLNEHIILERNGAQFCLAGVNDITAHYNSPGHKSDPDKALQDVPEDLVKILLAHQPRSIYDANRLGVALQLSGHTHGGQFFPFNLGVKLAHPYSTGLHDHNGTMIYVNRGTGYWGPPLRIGIPSEITVLTLRKSS